MFILLVSYKVPLETVEKHLAEHRAYLDQKYASGQLVVSGKQNPRVGGVIVCRANNRAEVERIISEDPFSKNGVADYQVIEFEPTKCAVGLEQLLSE